MTEEQSVSKWESETSTPDLDKIIKMSDIFGVSTDYLLKDEIEENFQKEYNTETMKENDIAKQIEKRIVSVDEAETYMSLARRVASKLALGVLLCIMSPICLITLSGTWEYGYTSLSEEGVAGIGIIVLLLMIAIGVGILIYAGMQLGKYEYLEKEAICLQDGIFETVAKRKEEFSATYRACIVIGVMLCILSVVPMMIAVALSAGDFYYICCVGGLLALIAVAVFSFIWSGTIQGSYDKLLQEGDFTIEKKETNKKLGAFPGIYWCIVTAIFFALGFTTNAWRVAGLIWPIAGVLFAAFMGIMNAVVAQKK